MPQRRFNVELLLSIDIVISTLFRRRESNVNPIFIFNLFNVHSASDFGSTFNQRNVSRWDVNEGCMLAGKEIVKGYGNIFSFGFHPSPN